MSNLFERKIREYAGIILVHEPVSGHRERFASKLALRKKTNRMRRIQKVILCVTATAAMLTGIVFFMQSLQPDAENGDSLSDVEQYYAMQFEDKVSEIEVLLEQEVAYEDRVAVLDDIEKMKTETARTLQRTDEGNIQFIVGLYSSKIEALEHIRDILE